MMTVEDFQKGKLLLIDKPLEWSSFQVVNKLRWGIRKKFSLKKIKVGHAGTLDPLASGLLLVCTGKFTKKLSDYQALTKEYTGIFQLGATTPSFDLETEIDKVYPTEHITEKKILETAQKFVGVLIQKPPLFSAVKKEGERLYHIARKGESVKIPLRKIHIYEFEITQIMFPKVSFRVVCSKGTYIRSLSHDFGMALNSGAHLTTLRRTKIGNFKVKDAIDPVTFVDKLLTQ